MSSQSGMDTSVEDGENSWKYERIIIAAILVTGIIGVINNPSSPLAGFIEGVIIYGVVGGSLLLAIIWGAKIGMENQQQQQQQEIGSSSVQKEPCPHCGWQNPSRNNYCHDCGSQLDKEEQDNEVEKIQEKYAQGDIDEETFEEKVEESLEQRNE